MIVNGWYTHECASTTKLVEVNRFAAAQTNNSTESNRKMHNAEKTLTRLSVLVFFISRHELPPDKHTYMAACLQRNVHFGSLD